jgi:hypothetical protein
VLARVAFEYVVVRVVPRVERGECMNVAVMLICRERPFLGARALLDRARLRAFSTLMDDDMIDQIECQLNHMTGICSGDTDAGPIALLSQRERWHWLAAPASTVVQHGPVHSGLCIDPVATLDHLYRKLVAIDPVE